MDQECDEPQALFPHRTGAGSGVGGGAAACVYGAGTLYGDPADRCAGCADHRIGYAGCPQGRAGAVYADDQGNAAGACGAGAAGGPTNL